MAFTVTRVGGSEGAVSASYTINLTGTANAADLATAALTGTVSFADGQASATILVPIAGDIAIEGNETLSVTLSAPTGGVTITNATAIGTIVNDDYPPAANVFINEFHYDTAGTDAGEFIEVAGLAGTDLSGWSLVLYNGNGGACTARSRSAARSATRPMASASPRCLPRASRTARPTASRWSTISAA
jgi:hypothetical protein